MHYNLSLFVNSETLLQAFCKEELLKRTKWAKAIKKSDYKILQEKKWNKLMQFWQTWESRYVSEKKKGQNYFQRIYLVFYNVLWKVEFIISRWKIWHFETIFYTQLHRLSSEKFFGCSIWFIAFKVKQSMKNIRHSFSEYLTKGLMYCAQITRSVMLLQIFISKIA